jgi:protein tyrosine phosphatase
MVKLNNIQGNVEAEKYINANYINVIFYFIKTVVKDQKVIATQGPLSTTVYNFWRMVDENNIKVIYMLCNLE